MCVCVWEGEGLNSCQTGSGIAVAINIFNSIMCKNENKARESFTLNSYDITGSKERLHKQYNTFRYFPILLNFRARGRLGNIFHESSQSGKLI